MQSRFYITNQKEKIRKLLSGVLKKIIMEIVSYTASEKEAIW